jgi:hypothetical protein
MFVGVVPIQDFHTTREYLDEIPYPRGAIGYHNDTPMVRSRGNRKRPQMFG